MLREKNNLQLREIGTFHTSVKRKNRIKMREYSENNRNILIFRIFLFLEYPRILIRNSSLQRDQKYLFLSIEDYFFLGVIKQSYRKVYIHISKGNNFYFDVIQD